MQSDPLQQLRDIHLPSEPGWWPPAPGWWLLLAALLLGLGWLARLALRRYRAGRPLRASRRLMSELKTRFNDDHINTATYLHQANEILKRLLVIAHAESELTRLSGQPWLAALDRLSNSEAFTSGPGKALGAERFSASPNADIDAVHTSIMLLLNSLPPPRNKLTAAATKTTPPNPQPTLPTQEATP